MKIISKYKDFYDYIVSDFDASISYVRSPEIVRYNYDDMLDFMHRKTFTYYKRTAGDIDICNYIFGIYPYIYSQIYFLVTYCTDVCTYQKIIIPSNTFVNKLMSLKSDEDIKNEIINYCKNEVIKDTDINEIYIPRTFQLSQRYGIRKSLSYCVWKIECSDMFFKLKAPVYIRYDYSLLLETVYGEFCEGRTADIHYVTNVCFSKLNYNILKYWYNELYDINTYNRIENFLWASKQEPISNPDNKTKILSHGFDLKTSFRKM